MLPVSEAEKLVHAFMTSRLDYCNALLGGCPASSINKLQVVQNAAAGVLTRSRKYQNQNQNQKELYCQVCLHTQGICLGVRSFQYRNNTVQNRQQCKQRQHIIKVIKNTNNEENRK